LFEQPNDRRWKSKPAVKQQIVGMDAAIMGLLDQILEDFRSFANISARRLKPLVR